VRVGIGRAHTWVLGGGGGSQMCLDLTKMARNPKKDLADLACTWRRHLDAIVGEIICSHPRQNYMQQSAIDLPVPGACACARTVKTNARTCASELNSEVPNKDKTRRSASYCCSATISRQKSVFCSTNESGFPRSVMLFELAAAI